MSEIFLQDDIHITDLRNCRFFIPSYQRGYKWRPRDVKYLINDLLEYNGDKPYYMQPLVVAEKDGKYIVVDGQQRLTTFFLIWRQLNKYGCFENYPFGESTCFSLEYEKRQESTTYLSFIGGEPSLITPDVRNFKKAEEAVDEILKNLDNDQIRHLEENFFKKATFLWYMLEDPDEGPTTFERLNGKRIALTDVELCKVLVLSDSCYSTTQRNEWDAAWQIMEYRLQDNQFCSFISKDFVDSHDQSRMSYVLDIALSKMREEQNEYLDYPLYNRLKSDIRNGKNVWRSFIQTFHRMEQMFDNTLYYNLIGFLINGTSTELRDIMEDSVSPDFGKKLVKRINGWVGNEPLGNLEYNNEKTKPALLLFNILCDLTVKSTDSDKMEDKYGFIHRFRFDLMKSEKYDKEHVHATHSQQIRSAIEWQQWIRQIRKYLPADQLNEIKSEYSQIMEKVEKVSITPMQGEDEESIKKRLTEAIMKVISSSKFEDIFNEVSRIVGEGDDDETQNSIGNMALLNLSINRDQSYAAAPFAVKRGIIHERVKQGVFVPKGTQLMFDKSFRQSPDEMYHWAKDNYVNGALSDKDAFIDFFIETINKLKA